MVTPEAGWRIAAKYSGKLETYGKNFKAPGKVFPSERFFLRLQRQS